MDFPDKRSLAQVIWLRKHRKTQMSRMVDRLSVLAHHESSLAWVIGM